jgi:ribosomal protein L11 methyltransferase
MEPPAVLRIITSDLDEVDTIEAMVWWHGAESVAIVDDDNGHAVVAGFVDEATARSAAAELAWPSEIEVLVDDVWMDAWKQFATVTNVGTRFVIVPSWLESPVTDRVIVRIDPGRSFGSGSHPSTVLALEAYERVMAIGGADGGPVTTVFDVGCGSGVLAIAAVLAGATLAVGVDTDPIARQSTVENAALNGVTQLVTVAGSTIDEAADVRGAVTFANIGRPVLLTIWDELMRSAPIVILSGLLTDQAEQLAAKATAQGRSAVLVGPRDGWSAVLIEGR